MGCLQLVYDKTCRNRGNEDTFLRWFMRCCRLLGIRKLGRRIGGKRIYVSAQDLWGVRKVYFRGKYDKDAIGMLQEILDSNKNCVFWDVGANYGS